jgi:hypothetical protein
LEIIDELEKQHDSEQSEPSDDESNIVKTREVPSDIYITPPDDGHITDEDSGEENVVRIDNLPGSQLIVESNVVEDTDNTIAANNKQAKSKKKIKI